jgi:hypothetical protein
MMKTSTLLAVLLLPSFALAQESQPASAPVIASQPTSLPSSSITTAQPVVVPITIEQTPALQNYYHRSPETAYKISLYSTVAGLAGSACFISLGLVASRWVDFSEEGLQAAKVSQSLFNVGSAFSVLALIGPSLGHAYAGEWRRGADLLLKRIIKPELLAGAGIFSAGVSLGLIRERERENEPIKAGPIIGMGAGISLFAAGSIYFWILSFRHIEDARKSPGRVAAQRGLKLAGPILLPTPVYDPRSKTTGLGATLKLSF